MLSIPVGVIHKQQHGGFRDDPHCGHGQRCTGENSPFGTSRSGSHVDTAGGTLIADAWTIRIGVSRTLADKQLATTKVAIKIPAEQDCRGINHFLEVVESLVWTSAGIQ